MKVFFPQIQVILIDHVALYTLVDSWWYSMNVNFTLYKIQCLFLL